MTVTHVRETFLRFFKEKGHAIVPSASLLPENDPTVLFTTAGMQPLVPYLSGNPHPMGTRLADAQKCLRTDDIEEVGDNRHLTFFEMLGNWSLGDYFKQEAITWAFELLTDKKWFGIDPLRLAVTVFEGDDDAPRDEESIGIWQAQFEMLGIAAEIGVANVDEPANGNTGPRIYAYPKKKNWWPGPTMKGLCGPDTEIFYNTGKPHDPAFGPVCHPNCDCGRWVEIWNNVFMQFERKEEGGALMPLPSKNVDTGMGLERMVSVLNNVETVFDIPEFQAIIGTLEEISGQHYSSKEDVSISQRGSFATAFVNDADSGLQYRSQGTMIGMESINRSMRIIADHIRAATFVIGDSRGVAPSNVGQGYIVRRLLRRSIREGRKLGIVEPFLSRLALTVIGQFGNYYTELETNKNKILDYVVQEEIKFEKTVELGIRKLRQLVEEKVLTKNIASNFPEHARTREEGFDFMKKNSSYAINVISGYEAFDVFQTYGFPLEMIQEDLDRMGREMSGIPFYFNTNEFEQAEKKHQELSRTASAGMFKGGLADHSIETIRLHTAHHLLLKALQIVLGPDVKQRGSNITSERLRIDFLHEGKLTDEQKKEVERIVNEKIKEDLPVIKKEMRREDAENLGAEREFGQKYPDMVTVYSVGPKEATIENPRYGEAFSMEFCGGPHVAHTGELGRFKIQKEEAVSAGVRRIKATVTG